jgi:soluble lytic murein transglycosylase-like protein
MLLITTSFNIEPEVVEVEKIVEIEKIVYIDKLEYKNINIFITGLSINKIIKFYRDNYPEDYEKILIFYDEYTKSREITTNIINYSIEYGNPINLMFSLAKRESDFDPKMEQKNSNKTWDRGLFQLNSGSRKSWKKTDFFNIAKNTKEASGVMQWLLSKYDDEELALASYNAGYYRVQKKDLPYITSIHVFEIKKFEFDFNYKFNINILPVLNHITFNNNKIELLMY